MAVSKYEPRQSDKLFAACNYFRRPLLAGRTVRIETLERKSSHSLCELHLAAPRQQASTSSLRSLL